jgi:hypothetical protein
MATSESKEMQFTEQVNVDALNTILLNLSLFKLAENKTDEAKLRTELKRYVQSLDKDGRVTVTYSQNFEQGRFFARQPSLQGMRKEIRHTISDEFNIDIDIQNCHPVLLEHICNQFKIDTPVLAEINRDRASPDSIYRNVKHEIIVLINNGDLIKSVSANDILSRFSVEMNFIQKELIKRLPEDYKFANKIKPSNPTGRFVNMLLCDLENECLQVMVSHLTSTGIKVTSLVFDGIMVEKTAATLERLPDLLVECENVVAKSVGVQCKILRKEMNCKLNLSNHCPCVCDHSTIYQFIRLYVASNPFTTVTDRAFVSAFNALKGITSCCFEEFYPKLTFNCNDNVDIATFGSNLTQVEALEWLITSLSTRKVAEKALREKFQEVLQSLSVCDVDRLDGDEPMDLNYTAYELVNYCRTHIFESKQKMYEELPVLTHKCIRELFQPPSFVISADGGFDIIKLDGIKGMVSWRTKTGIEAKEVTKIMSSCRFRNATPLYSCKTFKPNPADVKKGEINTYTGFRAKRVDEVNMELIEPILRHIRNGWANCDDGIYDYLLHWFQIAWKTPWIKTEVVPVLFGVEGSGKGLLIDKLIVPFIYGSRTATTVQGVEPIAQRFNGVMLDKLFICCNEVTSENGQWYSNWDKIKALITDYTVTIEKKGIDLLNSHPNYCNFIFCTNNLDSVKLGRTDRRYLCLETSSQFKGDYKYFSQLVSYCNQETANHLFTYVCDRPKTRNLTPVPSTSLKEEMMIAACSSVELFVNDALETNWEWVTAMYNSQFDRRIDDLSPFVFQLGKWIQSKHLYRLYLLYCTDNKLKARTSHMFGRELKRMKNVEFTRQKTGVVYQFNEV